MQYTDASIAGALVRERSEVVLASPSLSITTPDRDDSEARVLRVAGDLDAATAPLLQDVLQQRMQEGARAVLDLSAVNFLGVAGVEVLLEANRRSPISLVAQRGPVRRALAITGADDELTVHLTLVDAELSLNGAPLTAVP